MGGSHHERQRCRVVPLCRHHRGHGSPEPWLPATRLPSSRKPSPEAPFPLALLPPDPTRCPSPSSSSHLRGSRTNPQPAHECSSQEAPLVLKFHTGCSCGAVQPRFCGGSAPQKRFFVRLPPVRKGTFLCRFIATPLIATPHSVLYALSIHQHRRHGSRAMQTVAPITTYRLTDHAQMEMARRQIPASDVTRVLATPEQTEVVQPGRVVY